MQNTFCIIYFAFSKHFYSRIVQLKKTTYHSCDFLVAHIYPCESRSIMSDSLRHHDSTRLLCPWESPGKNTGVDSCSLLQGIFPTQGSNPGLPYCRWILYCLSPSIAPALYFWCWESTCMWVLSLQSCLTLCDPIDGSPPGSPVPGILQARTLEWVAIAFSIISPNEKLF